MVTKKYCDRCNKELKKKDNKTKKTLFTKESSYGSEYPYYEGIFDLCFDCMNEFKKWVKG